MAVIECSRCGGQLDVNSNMSVGTCKFCGSVITIPREAEKKSYKYGSNKKRVPHPTTPTSVFVG